jgi:hypothetical protein
MFLNKLDSINSIVFIILILAAVEMNHLNPEVEKAKNSYTVKPCPKEVDYNRKILVDFITHSEWSSSRQKTNTDHLEKYQMNVLTSPAFSSTCKELNNQYQETISKKRHTGEPRYNLTYYKAGDFYFVTISLRQPDNSDEVVVGLSFLVIHDKNLKTIKGYSF